MGVLRLKKEPEIVKILRQEEMLRLVSQDNIEQFEIIKDQDEELTDGTKGFSDDNNKELYNQCIEDENIKFRELTCNHILENSPDSIITIDKSGIITSFNKASEQITGYSKSEVVGKHFTKLKTFKKRDIPKLIKLFAELKLGKKTGTFEIEFVHKNGSTQWSEIHFSKIKENGKTKGYMAISRNITDRKKSDLELKHSYNVQATIAKLLSISLENISLEDMFKKFLDHITSIEWLAIKSKGAIFLAENDKQTLILKAQKNFDKNILNSCTKVPFGKCLCGRAAKSKKIVFADSVDVRHDIRYKSMPPHGHYCVPILSSQKELIGIITLYVKEGHIEKKLEKDFLQSVANVLSGIIQRKKIEKITKESEERYRALFESINDGIIIADIKTQKFKYVNPAICKLLGYNKKELINMKLQDIHPDYFLKEAEKGFKNHSKGNKFISENTPLVKKDGSIIYADVNATNISINGNLFNVGIFRDVTDRIKREADLIKFSRVIEQSQTSVIITDEKGDIEYINPKFEKVSGYSKDELIGKNTNILNSGKTNKKTYEKLWESILSGKTWEGELLNKKKNGELYWENVIITPIKNQEGKITNFVASKEDITEKKKIREEMKVKDHAIRSSINAIVIANSVGNVSYVNPSFLKLWGYYDQKDVIDKPIVKFWQMKGQYMQVMDAMVNKGGWVGELTAERADGTTFPVQLSANLVKDENGEMKYMMASFVDLTKQKKAEEKLLEKQKRIEEQNIKLKKLDELKSTFLNVTSHELRTPMSSIKGYVQMIIKQTLGNVTDEQNKALNVVLRNVERLDHLIQDILDISRLESGTMKFIPENTDISKMIEEIAETMKSSAETKQIEIKTDVKIGLPELFIDQDRVKQVIINFINNAIKFSEPETSITIKASKENENILFEVEDQGRGIPENKINKVFDTFYQVDSGMDRKFGGAGLGLAISRGIVLSHGGKIWVESKKGKGSTFKFTLPIEGIKDIEDKFREIDVFRLNKKEVKDEYDEYKHRMKI